MENGKLLSIIIPAYNVEDYIEQCLDSIFDGMSEEAAELTEVIVVNDGSTDQTGEILKNYKQMGSPLKIIEKENGGASTARNVGLCASCGKYIFFIDSDDYLLKAGFHDLFNFLQKHDDEFDIIDFEMCLFWDNTGVIEYEERTLPRTLGTGQDVFTIMEKANLMNNSSCTRILKHSLIIENGMHFFEGIESEDEEWTPKLFSYAKKVIHLPICVYVYRMRDTSVTHVRLTKRCFTDLIQISDSLMEFSKSPHLSDAFRKTLLGVISYIYWRSFRGIKLGGVWDEELIADIEKRFYIMDYSTRFHRKYIYRPFIRIFGLKTFYAIKYRNENL
ncbi:glycosyltransferase [uncultured Cloacibacillus sp.]|uniref:glycosyltransferase family 2 protein n=1 Tax=uncultured Cloacibacillus sp. TaxID=889794 RepID=UPI0026DBAEAC|nr:glycosyltransferase [uncultured Cloacibacillus sp.]